jgi:uncharacterized membrane protein
MKTRFFILLLAVILALVAIPAYALTSLKTVSVTYTVLTAAQVKSVEVYSDANMTTQVTTLGVGNITQGDSKQFTLYVKNTGNQALNLNTSFSITGDSFTANPSNTTYLGPGTSGTWTFTLTVSLNTTIGNKTALITFGE